MQGLWTNALFAILLLVGGVLWWIFAVEGPRQAQATQAQADVLQTRLDDWLRKPASTGRESPYIRGKVVPVAHSEHRISCSIDRELFAELPYELRATTPEEVGTIVWIDNRLEFFKNVQFQYGITQAAYTPHCTITIIDRARSVKLDSRTFRGIDPDTASDGKDFYEVNGLRPYAAMRDYLVGLPRQK
jgi:hypothetical protein